MIFLEKLQTAITWAAIAFVLVMTVSEHSESRAMKHQALENKESHAKWE